MEKVMTQDEFKNSVESSLDDVCSNGTPLRIKRDLGENVIVISEKGFSSLEETAYLLQSKANAKQ